MPEVSDSAQVEYLPNSAGHEFNDFAMTGYPLISAEIPVEHITARH